MRWGLFATRMFIVLVNVAIAAIIILSIVPLAQGGLDIRMPQGDSQWQYADDVLRMQMPVEVYNGGYYDIQDFILGFSIRDNASTELVSFHTAPVDIVHGRWTDVPLALAIDLNQVDPATVGLLVFHDASLNMSIDVQAQYIDRMVKIDLGGYSDMNWSALISGLTVDTAAMAIQPNGTLYTVTVPYHFEASDLIRGTHLTVGATLRNSTTVLGTTSQAPVIQQDNNGEFSLNISPAAAQDLMAHPQTLYIDSSATFGGATLDQTSSFQWQPFVSNMSIGSPYLSGGGPTNELLVPYYFEASALAQGQPATVQVTINDTSSTIASGSVLITMQAANSGEVPLLISASTYQWLLDHGDDWTVSVQLELMGITVEQQQSYLWNGGSMT